MELKFQVENGTFGFGERILFDNVNVEIENSDVLTILGPNGAGKTTFLKCLMGITPWISGSSSIDGQDIRAMTPREIATCIAYVPQMKSTSFDYTVRDMVLMGRSPHISALSDPSQSDEDIADECMGRMGIGGISERSYRTLSGGEMQLVLIARALASKPKILVMDEPESNLDYYNQLKIMDLIEGLSDEVMCIINTHYPDHAMRISDKTLMLDGRGGFIFGDSEEVITEANLSSVFRVRTIIGEVSSGERDFRYIVPLSARCDDE